MKQSSKCRQSCTSQNEVTDVLTQRICESSQHLAFTSCDPFDTSPKGNGQLLVTTREGSIMVTRADWGWLVG